MSTMSAASIIISLTEISGCQSVRGGKVEWSGMSEHSPVDRAVCKPDSQPEPPSRLPCLSPSESMATDFQVAFHQVQLT